MLYNTKSFSQYIAIFCCIYYRYSPLESFPADMLSYQFVPGLFQFCMFPGIFKDHLIGNSNFKQFLFFKDFQCLGAGSKGQANSVHNVMYLRIFYRCILIQHSDIYIFSGHVMGDQDLGMQLIAAHLQANLRFIALQFTKLCKTVIQTISSVTASQHLQTQRTISPCFVA